MFLGIGRDNVSNAELFRRKGQGTVSDKVIHRRLRCACHVSEMANNGYPKKCCLAKYKKGIG